MCVSPGNIIWVGIVFSVGQIQLQVASAFSVFCVFIFSKGLVHLLSMITIFLSSSSPFVYQNKVSHTPSCSLNVDLALKMLFFEAFLSSSFPWFFLVFFR